MPAHAFLFSSSSRWGLRIKAYGYYRPQIAEVAVVGVASEQWGQKVAAVIVLRPDQAQSGRGGKTWGVMDMRRSLKDKLANYKIPQELKVVEALPKNAMGKSRFCVLSSFVLTLSMPGLANV